ncbi:MAG: ISAzo13 family transposase [Candidatus Bathyarchaeota archaeon]|nr:ISAzo13 family transposase [Candidatus Termitimicrobium sp.]
MEKEEIRSLWDNMKAQLNEKQRRQYAATLAKTYGYGGATIVHQVTGIALNTITAGKKDLQNITNNPFFPENIKQIRKTGGGRKKLETNHPNLPTWIEEIVTNQTYGNPQNPLVWTTKSLRNIQKTILTKHKMHISFKSIGTQLKKLGYSLQQNKKMLQIGESHPDRNQQFEHINQTAKTFLKEGQPVISVDTKKKELVGNYANNGLEYRLKKSPRLVFDHDFPVGELLKVAPYGVYVVNDNSAFVNLGTSCDTGEFAVESISRWWETVGRGSFPGARLLVNCDCGGSNSYRARLWKVELQRFADRSGLDVFVCHLPPGTSKWNKVEHRLFCYISKSWAGKPLVDVETVVSLISNTTTRRGLRVVCQSDSGVYLRGKKVSDEEFKAVNISKIGSHDEWNYIISPTR